MKYSLSFQLEKLNPQEIKCPYHLLGKLNDLDHSKRYNILFNDAIIPKNFYKTIEYIVLNNINYTIGCRNMKIIEELIKNGYNAYCVYPITDWEMFYNLQQLGVTDIVIDGPLGFQMDKIKNNKQDTFIRVVPNCSNSALISKENNINSFFIRPEDIDNYNEIIDFIEFDTNDCNVEEILFKIYQKKQFNKSLDILVKQINVSVLNSVIPKKFVLSRLNCQQKCKENHKCRICQRYVELTQLINKHLSNSN